MKSENILDDNLQDFKIEIEKDVEKVDLGLFHTIIDNIEIENENDCRNKLSFALQLRKICKNLEEKRKQMCKPYYDYQKSISKIVFEHSNNLFLLERKILDKLSKWMIEQEENPFTKLEKIECDEGAIKIYEEIQWVVKNELMLDKDLMCPDEDAIQQLIDDGVLNIPGIEIKRKKHCQARLKSSEKTLP